MPAATPIPKLAALLVMVTAVALVSHEVSAVSANATEAHKSMSASAMLVSRDTNADPKYDMHSLRTGDTTRAEAAEERGSSFENLRNTVRSWAKGVKLKFWPYRYEQLHSVSINSANDGLRPSPSVINIGETDETVLSGYQTEIMYLPSLIGMTKSPVRLENSDLTENELQYLKSLCNKEPFFDVAKGDTVFNALATLRKTAHDHLLNMYIARDNAITDFFSVWKKESDSSVAELVKSIFFTSDLVAELYQLKFESYCHSMAVLPTGRLNDLMDANSQAKWLFYYQPFPDVARTQFSPGLSDADLIKATRKFNANFYLRDIEIQKFLSTQKFTDVEEALKNEGIPTLVARLYKLVYKSKQDMLTKRESDAEIILSKVLTTYKNLNTKLEDSKYHSTTNNFEDSRKAGLKEAGKEKRELVAHIEAILAKR